MTVAVLALLPAVTVVMLTAVVASHVQASLVAYKHVLAYTFIHILDQLANSQQKAAIQLTHQKVIVHRLHGQVVLKWVQ